MIDPNPAPTLPALEADNAIDVDKLGSAKLMTYINFPDIENSDGDTLILNFRGCAADGTVVDELNNQVTVDTSLLTPDGMPAEIENHTIVNLDQGWAFYSYRVQPFGNPTPGDESKRIFFYVGKRPRARPALPVLQIKESHDLQLDVDAAPTLLGVFMVPYEALAVGDVVTLHCRRFYADGQEYLPALAYPKDVLKADLGKPLALHLPKSDLRRVNGGRVEIRYGIQYADTTDEKTLSATQTFQLTAPDPATLLPALTIVGHTSGTPIKPSQFLEGMPLRIDAWPGMSAGDEVLCYVDSEADAAHALILKTQVDISTIDRGFIEFLVPGDWVMASNGYPINLQYQFAWIGAAMSSVAYPAVVRDRLNLPMVIVEGARPGNPPVVGEGDIDAVTLVSSGINLRLDDDASYVPVDKIEVHWDGYGTTGKHTVSTPTVPGGRTFNIPSRYIPANMDRQVPVYYYVTPQGEDVPEKSGTFTVRVVPVPKTQYPTIQSTQAQGSNGSISIVLVPAQGERFFFQPGWVYMREDQILNALLKGKNSSGQDYSFPLFDQHVVTKAEVDSKLVEMHISAAELRKFQLGNLTVAVTITYEPGAVTTLNDARFTLQA
ncbi:hypothetical protein [Pseudomonas sp. KK4]|uniref:hypothetical protein n=1 Tax=Pseudomonas sp. KK4 TaxID=1855729 RepID=UPI00097C2A15|nr:hypothetical protein [Pseudomonas sp. KK4]